jgi:hypothetical protein
VLELHRHEVHPLPPDSIRHESPKEQLFRKHMGSSTLSTDKASPNQLQHELLNTQARLDQQQERSFETIQGELAKLTSMASRFYRQAIEFSTGKQT